MTSLRKSAATLTLAYLLSLACGSLLFIGLFRSDLLRSETVLFNRAIWLLIPVCLVVAGIFELARCTIPSLRAAAASRDGVIIFLLLFFGNWTVYGLIPFNVSRSNSVILVGYLAASGTTPRTEAEIVEFVNDFYINRYRAIQRRIAEQIALGNVQRQGDGYVLTAKGRSTVWLMNTVTSWFRAEPNFLNVNLPREAPEARK